jgi:hypothetical protein
VPVLNPNQQTVQTDYLTKVTEKLQEIVHHAKDSGKQGVGKAAEEALVVIRHTALAVARYRDSVFGSGPMVGLSTFAANGLNIAATNVSHALGFRESPAEAKFFQKRSESNSHRLANLAGGIHTALSPGIAEDASRI